MQPVTFEQLLNSRDVTTVHCGIVVQPQPTWVVPGETRLSYTTLTRLVECCREYHWQTDIAYALTSKVFDETCKSISAEFLKPISISTTFIICYEVKQIKERGYELRFKIQSVDEQITYAIFDAVFVLYNTETNHPIVLPELILSRLLGLIK